MLATGGQQSPRGTPTTALSTVPIESVPFEHVSFEPVPCEPVPFEPGPLLTTRSPVVKMSTTAVPMMATIATTWKLMRNSASIFLDCSRVICAVAEASLSPFLI